MNFYDLNEALEMLLGGIKPIALEESVGLFDLCGRVLAQPVIAQRALPPFDNSAMDGYGVLCADAGKNVEIVNTIFAGDAPTSSVTSGACVKVMTGAPIPAGCEAIVPFENGRLEGDRLWLPEDIKAGHHIKRAGEEVAPATRILEPGWQLGASHVALLASQGLTAATVYRPLRVAVLSGGDEVVEPWQTPGDYQIYNTNSVAIVSELKAHGYEAIYASLSADDEIALSHKLAAVLGSCDAVITTGGISVGEADFTRAALERLGVEIFFHGLNLKPGRPTLAGRVGQKLVVALPGNPLSAIVGLRLIVLPALAKLQGGSACHAMVTVAQNDAAFSIKSGRDTALLGYLESGRFLVTRGGQYGSGMLMPIAESNAIALFASDVSQVADNQTIFVMALSSPLSAKRIDPINR